MGKQPGSRPSEPILRAEGLRVRYRNGALGILDVSFQVSPGEVIGVFGANGAGKTSTVRAVSGFLRSEGTTVSGKVTFDGRNLTNRDPHRAARLGMFMIPERQKVFANLSVWENLMTIGRLPRGPRRAELVDLVFNLFPILAGRRRQQAGGLSGGERQMLALGRGILSDPKVLIIDEMTLGLHHSVQPPLFDAVRRVADAGAAVVIVDESTGFALATTDYCYVLSAGEVHDEGPSERFHESELIVAGYVDAG